jgi:hypothetical protein
VIFGWEYPSVAVTVDGMGGTRTSYDEFDTPAMLRADAAAAGRALRRQRVDSVDGVTRVTEVPVVTVAGAPSLAYDAFPREVSKREITVDEAAARIADALGLGLD